MPSNTMTEKKKALIAYKEKILKELRYYDQRIEEIRSNGRKDTFFEDSDSSDSDAELPINIDFGPNLPELKKQQTLLRTYMQATQELTNVQVIESEVNVLTEDPIYQGEPPVTEEGIWREVTAECRVDLVPFWITFFIHEPHRLFAQPSYRSVHVTAVKSPHEAELKKSILSTVRKPSDAVEILKGYAVAHRSRRTTLARLAEKFANSLYMEPMADGGYHLKCANLLEVSWILQNKWSPVAPFHHRMKFDLEYMDESYIKIITQAHRQLNDPSIESEERTFLLSKIISTCLEAQGPTQELYDSMSSDPETAQSLRKRRTTLDREPEVPIVKKKKDSEAMAPPKSIPKKAKPKGKENINKSAENVATAKNVDKEGTKDGGKGKKVGLTKNLSEPIISTNVNKNIYKPKMEKAKTDTVIVSEKPSNININEVSDVNKKSTNTAKNTENSDKIKGKGVATTKNKDNPTKVVKEKVPDNKQKSAESGPKSAAIVKSKTKPVKEKAVVKNKQDVKADNMVNSEKAKSNVNPPKTANNKISDKKNLDKAEEKGKSVAIVKNKIIPKEKDAVKENKQASSENKVKDVASTKVKANPTKLVKESNKENNLNANKNKENDPKKGLKVQKSVPNLKRKSNLADKHVQEDGNVATAKKPKLCKPEGVASKNNTENKLQNVNKVQNTKIKNKPVNIKNIGQNKPKIFSGGITSLKNGNTGKVLSAGNSAEKVSKIPQIKLSTNVEARLKKNPLKLSPLKLPSKFKTLADVNKQKSIQKTTNIPRLLKKPSPKT